MSNNAQVEAVAGKVSLLSDVAETLHIDIGDARLYCPRAPFGKDSPWRMSQQEWEAGIRLARESGDLIKQKSLEMGVVKSDRKTGLSCVVDYSDVVVGAAALGKRLSAEAFRDHAPAIAKALTISNTQIESLDQVRGRIERRDGLVLSGISLDQESALVLWVSKPGAVEDHPLCKIHSDGRVAPSSPVAASPFPSP